MVYAIKAEVHGVAGSTFEFPAQKTMYGGRRIAKGDTLFIFASENECGQGLVARGVVTSAKALEKIPGLARQTHSREHHGQANGQGKAKSWAEGVETVFELERRAA